MKIMTNEQIIELAKEHLEVLVADDDEMEFPTDFAATKEQLIEFAQRIRRGTMITLDTLKDSVYALHLTTEQNEEIKDIIETAYRLGCENGYDQAGINYQSIIDKLMSSVVGETND